MTNEAKAVIATFWSRWAPFVPEGCRKEFMEHIAELSLACTESGAREMTTKIQAELPEDKSF